MSSRAACQPKPRRHWPIFSVPGMPDGLGYCSVCWDYLTAVGLFESECPGYPTTEGVSGGCTQDGQPAAGAVQPIDGSPVTVAPPSVKHSDQLNALRSVDELDAERERTLAMIQRCAERQL